MITHLALVRWELPFPLRVPGELICWEPAGKAIVSLTPSVGEIHWRREGRLVNVQNLFPEWPYYRGPSPRGIPQNEYVVTADSQVGESIGGIMLHHLPGREGGFNESVPYTLAELVLAVFDGNTEPTPVFGRATECLNNVLVTYAMRTLNGRVRPLSLERHVSYLTVSFAKALQNVQDPNLLLRRWREHEFAAKAGPGKRADKIGWSGKDDVPIVPLSDLDIEGFQEDVRRKTPVRAQQVMALSALRRLLIGDTGLAILDAHSAVELCVEHCLHRELERQSVPHQDIEKLLEGELSTTLARIRRLDSDAVAQQSAPFEGTDLHTRWLMLVNLRHDVVHKGERSVTFEKSRAGIGVALETILFFERRHLSDERPWNPDLSIIDRLSPKTGSLLRIFAT